MQPPITASRTNPPAAGRGGLNPALWVYFVVAALSLAALSFMALSAAYFPWDLSLTEAMQAESSPTLDAVALAIDWPGYLPQIAILALVAAIGLYAVGRHRAAVLIVLTLVIESPAVTLVKFLVRRARPSVPGIHVYKVLGDYTYPSGHVASYVMLFGFLAYLAYHLLRSPVLRALLVTVLTGLIVLVGPVRIYLGEHWPSDVLGGYLIGTMGLIFIVWLYRRWGTRESPAGEG